jgi:hypothetical protein
VFVVVAFQSTDIGIVRALLGESLLSEKDLTSTPFLRKKSANYRFSFLLVCLGWKGISGGSNILYRMIFYTFAAFF